MSRVISTQVPPNSRTYMSNPPTTGSERPPNAPAATYAARPTCSILIPARLPEVPTLVARAFAKGQPAVDDDRVAETSALRDEAAVADWGLRWPRFPEPAYMSLSGFRGDRITRIPTSGKEVRSHGKTIEVSAGVDGPWCAAGAGVGAAGGAGRARSGGRAPGDLLTGDCPEFILAGIALDEAVLNIEDALSATGGVGAANLDELHTVAAIEEHRIHAKQPIPSSRQRAPVSLGGQRIATPPPHDLHRHALSAGGLFD
jgi:hypothetical protein